MQFRLASIVGAITLAALATSLHAQTIANGPYYATPSWDQTMPASSRFVVLANFANAAVLDRETGLVWQQAPAAGAVAFITAYDNCVQGSVNGRTGWRLPTITELGSLFDTSSPGSVLPAGNPFTLPPATASFGGTVFWSTTTTGPTSFGARYILGYSNFSGFMTLTSSSILEKNSAIAWCVRGPGSPGLQFQQ